MRALVISDIHGNSVALETVLKHTEGQFDAVWCLGDVVGYGPNPNECVALLKDQTDLVCLLGNHDAAAAKDLDISSFNPEARRSIDWTKNELQNESIEFLKNLPETVIKFNVTLVHGSPRQPVFEYLLDTETATENFEFFHKDYCFVGHTHLPVQYQLTQKKRFAIRSSPNPDEIIQLVPRCILNPGSVGQPRDRDTRAAFAIFDTEKLSWNFKRVPYAIEETQKRMKALKMNNRHIIRLSSGW